MTYEQMIDQGASPTPGSNLRIKSHKQTNRSSKKRIWGSFDAAKKILKF